MTYPPQQPQNPWGPQPAGFPPPSNPYIQPPPSASPYGPQNPYSAPPGQNPYQQPMQNPYAQQGAYPPGFGQPEPRRSWGVVGIGAVIFVIGMAICVAAVVNGWGVIWWGLPLWGFIMMLRGFFSKS